MNTIGFPGLGIKSFEINSIAFNIFGFDMTWAGLITAFSVVIAFFIFFKLASKKECIDQDDVYNVTLFAIPISVIGARIFYVVTHLSRFKDTGFIGLLDVRKGGISFVGAMIFAVAVVLIYSKKKKLIATSLLDAAAPAVLIGLAVGCFGDLVAGTSYGWTRGVEKLPWRMEMSKVYVDGILQTDKNFVHPTFIYKFTVLLIAVAIIFLFIYRRKKFHGAVFWFAAAALSALTAFTEAISADGENAALNVAACVIIIIISFIGAALSRRKNPIEHTDGETEYRSAFSAALLAVRNEKDALDESVFDIQNTRETEGSQNTENTQETEGSEKTEKKEEPNDDDN